MILEKIIDGKHWKLEVDVIFDHKYGWQISKLKKINGKSPKGYTLVNRFSSKEIQEALNNNK